MAAGGDLKIAKSKTFLLPLLEPGEIRQNGGRHWIQRIEYGYLPSGRRFGLQIKGSAGGDVEIAILGAFLIIVGQAVNIYGNGCYHWIHRIK